MRSGSCSFHSKCRTPYPSETAWQIFSGFPARTAGGRAGSGAANSRVLLPDLARYRFDWAAETQRTGKRRGRVPDNALAVAIAVPRPDWRSFALIGSRRRQLRALQTRLRKGLEGFPRLVLG